MNRCLLHVLVLSALLLAFDGSATSLQVVVVADSEDGSIGDGAMSNARRVSAFFKSAGDTLGITTNTVAINGQNGCAESNRCFSCDSIRSAISSVTIGSDDTVIFYYSGHGYREEGQPSKFPLLYCSEDLDQGLGLEDIAKRLFEAKPRLLIAVADACNVVVPRRPTAALAGPPTPEEEARRQRLRKLLLNHRGAILFSSSIPGQFSYYYPTGGVFTSRLLSELESAIKPAGSGLWADVSTAAVRPISVAVAPGNVVTQTPQVTTWNLSLDDQQASSGVPR